MTKYVIAEYDKPLRRHEPREGVIAVDELLHAVHDLKQGDRLCSLIRGPLQSADLRDPVRGTIEYFLR